MRLCKDGGTNDIKLYDLPTVSTLVRIMLIIRTLSYF